MTDDRQQIPGQADKFHEDAFVHGVACGLQEKYDLPDETYSLLVYGAEIAIDEHGAPVEDIDDAVALMAILPPMMPGGTPFPMTVPLLDGEDAYVVEGEADDMRVGDMQAFYDAEHEKTRIGTVVDTTPEENEASLLVGDLDDDGSVVIVETGGETNQVEINGTPIGGDWSMANDDDEHLKDWWRVEELEEQVGD